MTVHDDESGHLFGQRRPDPPGRLTRGAIQAAQKKFKPPGKYYLAYVGDVRAALWKLIAQVTGTRREQVWAVVCALREFAADARKDGDISGFDFEECASDLDLNPDDVKAIGRALLNRHWLADNFIVEWPDKQPTGPRDPTGAQRWRNKRLIDKARMAYQLGTATDEQLALLDAEERARLDRLAAATRVSERKAPPEAIAPFRRIKPAQDTKEARDTADAANEQAVKLWLYGDDAIGSYGPGCIIVAAAMGQTTLSAWNTISGWVMELGAGVEARIQIAEVVSAAHEQGLREQAFNAVVRQRIKETRAIIENGPALPFGPQAIDGKRRA